MFTFKNTCKNYYSIVVLMYCIYSYQLYSCILTVKTQRVRLVLAIIAFVTLFLF
jgi:hypothetical protein